MRKTTERACEALKAGKNFNSKNTQVINCTMYLFENAIARKTKNGIEICDGGGYVTATTRERLSGFLGYGKLSTKGGKWKLNGKEWNGEWLAV